MEKLVIGICDDESYWREQISEIILEYNRECQENIKVCTYKSAEEYLSDDIVQVDVLFLDIEMNGISGIELKNMAAKQKREMAIVFVSAYDSLMKEAFGKNVYGFLDKPIDNRKLLQILEAIIGERKNDLKIQVNETDYVMSHQIMYIQAVDKYVKIHTNEETYIGYYSLKECEEKFPANLFVRVQKSYMINFAYVKSAGSKIVMENGVEITVKRGKAKEIKSLYLQYLRGNAR